MPNSTDHRLPLIRFCHPVKHVIMAHQAGFSKIHKMLTESIFILRPLLSAKLHRKPDCLSYAASPAWAKPPNFLSYATD